MAEPNAVDAPAEAPPEARCAQCGTTVPATNRLPAGDRFFCRGCYETLRHEVENQVAAMTRDVNYPVAFAGAIVGGLIGAAAWWGFTAMTHIAFGLVAIAIGFLVARGAILGSGNKRSRGLQFLSSATAAASFLLASYLVNMTFINQALQDKGESFRVTFPPPTPDFFVEVVRAGFEPMDLLFLGIVIWQAWVMLAPPKLPPRVLDGEPGPASA